jgi:hypothetical protein
MKTFLRIPVWLLWLWLGTTITMSAWAYAAFPPEELKMTLFMSGAGLVAIVIFGAMGKFEKKG